MQQPRQIEQKDTAKNGCVQMLELLLILFIDNIQAF